MAPRPPASPYIVGPPVSGPHFYGRCSQVSQFFDMLRGPILQPLRVLGLRRSGKTSFLLHVAHPAVIGPALQGDPHTTVIVYVNLQGIQTPSGFYLAVADAVANGIPSARVPKAFSTFRSFSKWLESILAPPARSGAGAPKTVRTAAGTRSALSKLREDITRYFDIEELRTLCFDLGVDYDNLRGEGKAAKVRELVVFLDRRDRIPKLVRKCSKLRPNVSWKYALGVGQKAAATRPSRQSKLLRLRLVVLLDEFEELTRSPEFDVSFFGGLRALVTALSPELFTWVTVSYKDLYALSQPLASDDRTSPFFNIFHPTPIILGPLEPEEIERLICEPAKSKKIVLSPQEVRAIQVIAGAMPYLLQATAEQWFLLRATNPDLPVDQCREEVLARLGDPSSLIWNQLGRYWRHLSGPEQACLRQAALGTLSPGTSLAVTQKLERFGMLYQENDCPKVAGEVFRRWIELTRRNVPTAIENNHLAET